MTDSSASSGETVKTETVPQEVSKMTDEDKTNIPSSDSSLSTPKKEDIIVDSISKKDIPGADSAEEIASEKTTVQDSSESSSVVVSDDTEKHSRSEQREVSKTMETKELFPNFHISDKMNFDEEILGIQNITETENGSKTETGEKIEDTIMDGEPVFVKDAVSPEEKPSNDSPVSDKTEEVMETQAGADIFEQKPEVEAMEETTVSADDAVDSTVVPTPEYVAEIKTELSGQRRAGFRFFAQKKTKILAGLGLAVLSISAVVLFSDSFFLMDLQKS